MKKLSKLLRYIGVGLIITLVACVLGLTIRGSTGNPSAEYIAKYLIEETSPLEGSSSTARYALAMSLVNDKSFYLSRELATISTPDLAESHGHYVSLFAPGVSLLAVPFFALGKAVGNEQLITYAMSIILAFLNFVLIATIVKRLTGNLFAGLSAGIVFLFGTIAWPYATTLTQHHVSLFLMLASTLQLIKKPNTFSLILVGLLYSIGLLVDYPNGMIILPILILAFIRNVEISEANSKLVLTVRTKLIVIFIGLALGIVPTLWYNQQAHGSYTQLTSTLRRITDLETDAEEATASAKIKTVSGFLRPEKIPQGMDVLLTSQDRGLLLFSPVILFGLMGIAALARRNSLLCYTLVSCVVFTLALYSSWGDPWGGWAFGPRYLMPAIGVMAIFLGVAIHRFGKSWLFSLLFLPVALWSIFVNLTGALTTTLIPPSTEEAFITWPKPVVLYGLRLVQTSHTGSFFFNEYFINRITVQNFAWILFSSVTCLLAICYIFGVKNSEGKI